MNTRILSNKMGDWEGAVGLLRDPGEPCRTRRAPEARAPSPALPPKASPWGVSPEPSPEARVVHLIRSSTLDP